MFLGIDGEGQGREDHRYVLLAAADESGERKYFVEAEPGGRLSTEQCLDFILSLPNKRSRIFAYAFNYDLTKILTDVDDRLLYILFRPELRFRTNKGKGMSPRAISWRGYRINLQATKFTVRRGKKTQVIWDIFKFFQSKFVGALKDWKVGEESMRARMSLMKDKRSEFDKESPEAVREYCFEECRYMAELARRLIEAHERAGLHLKNFYGAGSSASAMLDLMGIKEKLVRAPKAMREAVASAFFGGRFENSVVGRVEGTVYNYDISSAYPYQTYFLPCLSHGKWRLTRRRADIEGERVKTACVRYSFSGPSSLGRAWSPLPFRTDSGAICFPETSGGGWVWLAEFQAASRHFPFVHFEEAWILESDCTCMPFEDIPKYYLERLRIGKEGPGIVLKLGINSVYGKLAQSIGSARYNSWIWAGIITAGTRAQILDMVALHDEPANLLMVATDGIYTRERLDCPKPEDTGTNIVVVDSSSGKSTCKPLGGWEEKVIHKGVFVARPGIYFPMDPTPDEIKDVRGRGVGKSVVLENWARIVRSWDEYGASRPVEVANISKFCGAKSSLSRSRASGSAYRYNRASGSNCMCEGRPHRGVRCPVAPAYGQWITRSIELSFSPMPKREPEILSGGRLALRSFSSSNASLAYNKAIRSEEARDLAQATDEILEQPDADLIDYEH
jgi:hypothetical protein